MEPMNIFVNEHKQQYRDFIDQLCAVPHAFNRTSSQPLQAAAQTIFKHLPPLVQEGIPALPYLIDYSRAFAALIKLWVDHKPHAIPVDNHTLKRFHHECINIHSLAEDCYASAERTNVIGRDFTKEWATMMDQMENDPAEFLMDEMAPPSGPDDAHRQPAAPERTIDFTAEPSSSRRYYGGNTGSSRPSSPSGRAPPDESRTRNLRGQFRFHSRSRSRPPTRQQPLTTTDDDPESSDDGGLAMNEAEPRKCRLQKERPSTAEKGKKGFWSRRGAEKHDKQGESNSRKIGSLC